MFAGYNYPAILCENARHQASIIPFYKLNGRNYVIIFHSKFRPIIYNKGQKIIVYDHCYIPYINGRNARNSVYIHNSGYLKSSFQINDAEMFTSDCMSIVNWIEAFRAFDFRSKFGCSKLKTALGLASSQTERIQTTYISSNCEASGHSLKSHSWRRISIF